MLNSIDIPLAIVARDFVGEWSAGAARATSAGPNTRTRRWPLASVQPCELLTTESNHVAGFTGMVEGGEPRSIPPADLEVVDAPVDCHLPWRGSGRVRGSIENGIVVLELGAEPASRWHRIDDHAWVGIDDARQLAAIAVAANPEAVADVTIVFDPQVEVEADVDNGWINLWIENEGDDDSDSSDDDDEDDDDDEYVDTGVDIGDFSVETDAKGVVTHLSAGCRREMPDLAWPQASGKFTEPLSVRTAAAGGMTSGHRRDGDELICVATFRDAPEGAWHEWGETGILVCASEDGTLCGIAARGRGENEIVPFDGDEEFDGPRIFVETSDGNTQRWSPPSSDELFARATNVTFIPFGAAAPPLGPGRVRTEDAHFQVEGDTRSSITVEYGGRESDAQLTVTSSLPRKPAPLAPRIAPEPLRYRVAEWIVQQETKEPRGSDPDSWRLTDTTRERRNELARAATPILRVPLVGGGHLDLRSLQGTSAWGAWGEHDGVLVTVLAHGFEQDTLELMALTDLGALREQTLASVGPAPMPMWPAPSPDEVSPNAIRSLRDVENVAERLASFWEPEESIDDVLELFAPDIVGRWGGADQLGELLALYRASSGGLGIKAAAIDPRTTPDGSVASGSIVVVRPSVDGDPMGSSFGFRFGGDDAARVAYDHDESNDIRRGPHHVEVRIRCRRIDDEMRIETDLPAILQEVYGAPEAAVLPSQFARPIAKPVHSIEVTTFDADRIADTDHHPTTGLAIARDPEVGPPVITIDDVEHPIDAFDRIWQIRWADADRLVVSGHRDGVADTVVYDIRSRNIVATFDRGPRAGNLAASARFVATSFDYDDGPEPHPARDAADVADPTGQRESIPRGPIGEGLAAFTTDGDYQIGWASHVGEQHDIDDYYPPPMVFTDDSTLVLYADESVVEIDVEHGIRSLHRRINTGYRQAIAYKDGWFFIMSNTDGDRDDVVIWEWRLGDPWATPIGTVVRERPRDGHGTSDGVFVSELRDGTGVELVRILKNSGIGRK